MTFDIPVVTYYRADVMEENGLSSEPGEFGHLLKNRKTLQLQKLKVNDQYIFQTPADLINLLGSATGVFDKDLNFVRDSSMYVEIMDIKAGI